MLVTCPKCKTTYKVSDELVQGAVPSFRCSRCRHTFDLGTQAPEDKPTGETSSPDQRSPSTTEKQELTFVFGAKKEIEALNEQDEEPFAAKSTPQGGASAQIQDRPLNQWSINDSEPKNEYAFSGTETGKKVDRLVDSPPSHAQTPEVQPASTEHETSDNILSLDPYRDHRVSTAPYLTLFALLVIFYGVVTVFNHSHPNAMESVVGKIPLVGSSLLKNTHLKDGVALQSLQASYQSIQGNREVFVITGVASNQNPVKIRELRVTGQIYNQEGKEIEQQTVWIGNAISAKIVRGMTAQDISDLQRLKPLKTFDIPPGDSVPFTIVFLKPAKEVKNFSCGVVAAEGETA
jgi:predicted Zn finger-like uncharacterized protein